MKNLKSIIDLPLLIKSLKVKAVLLLFFVTFNAFKTPFKGEVKKPNQKDSLQTDKSGFKSLFSASYFDPAKPYVAQLNPRAIPFVENYIRTRKAYFEKMKFWGKPYFDVYDGILNQYGLPKELKYLSVIESALIPGVVSCAGAVGPWQIMEDEARRMGLRIDSHVDERTSFYKSTHAAARILKELHKQFNDWTLVIAAYNCGAGRVRQAIRQSGSSNFWDLQAYLPLETSNHVKRFISTHYIFEGSGGLTTMTASELSTYRNAISRDNASINSDGVNGSLAVTGKYKSSIIAKNVGVDLQTFNKLNPNFDRAVATGATYNMRLPVEKIALFENNRHAILNESIEAFLNY